MSNRSQPYCSNCGGLGHLVGSCPKVKVARSEVVIRRPVVARGEAVAARELELGDLQEPEITDEPDVCPACGTNLVARRKERERRRVYMARKRKEGLE